MKKISLILSFVFMLVIATFMSSCGGKKEFKIMFTDYDGSVLYSENVKKGEMPSYPLDEPTRKPDEDYTYTFSEWWPALEKATEDTIYTAYYSRNLKQEYRVTFKNYDGSVLDEVTVKEGEKPKYLGETPTKPHDDTSKFLFTGWDRALEEVTGDTTYTASFRSFDLEKYIVVFQYEDESLIDAYEATEGDMAEYTGKTPTMEPTEDAKYNFRGWSPALGEVTEDVVYTAKFMATPYNYFVTIDTYGGESASNGKIESFKTDKISVDQFVFDVVKDNYRFDGWLYNNTLIFDAEGNALVNLDEIDFGYNVSITAHYVEEAIIDIEYVAYNEVNGFVIDRYDELPEKYGSGSVTGFHKWNASAPLTSELVSNEYYEFDGWYENDNLVSAKPSFNYYLFDRDVKLECRFTIKKYTIKMDVNNDELGEIMVKNHTVWESSLTTDFYYGEKITVVAKAISDIEFLGWYNFRNELITDDEYCTIEVGKTMSMHAKWDYFKIEYIMPNGVKNDANPTYYTSKMNNITLANPTTELFGRLFDYWEDIRFFRIITEIDTSELEDIYMWPCYKQDPDFNFDISEPSTVENAIIPEKVTEIPEFKFSLCENLKTILLPATIKTIGKDAFMDCASLEKVYYDGTIEDWLNISLFMTGETNPMYYASEFYLLDENGSVEYNNKKYSLLTDLVVENYNGPISLYKFTGFECLETVTVDSNVTGFGLDAFLGCGITDFYYNGTVADWCNLIFGNADANPMMDATNVYFLDASGTVLHNGKKYSKLTSITLPTNLVTLNDYVFAGWDVLKTVTISSGSSLKNIGQYAFYGCIKLTAFDASSANVENVGERAFYGCIGLTSVKFNSALKKFDKEAFAECSALTTIQIMYVKSMWTRITKGEDWNKNVPATVVKFNDGEVSL